MEDRKQIETLGEDLKTAGRKVWLMGLGAAASVEDSGRKLFSELVERGEKRRGGEGREWPRPIRQAEERMKTMGRNVEQRVEEGMTQTLHRLGVPARDDVQTLIDRIDVLSRKVEGLKGAQ